MRGACAGRGSGRKARGGTRRAGRAVSLTVSLAAAAGAVVLLAGCGVPTTGVIDVGVPASGLPTVPAAGSRAVLYFLDGGRLRPVRQEVGDRQDPVATAVELLLAGPAAAGRPDLSTHLLRFAAPSGSVAVRTQGRTVTVRLPSGIPAPDALGLRQLACTAATAFGAASPGAVLAPPRAAEPSGMPTGASAGGSSGDSGAGASASAASTPVPFTVPVQVEVVGPDWHRIQRVAGCPS